MLTSVQSAVISHLDITMESGHVKGVRPFSKEAFKVQSIVSCFFSFPLLISTNFAGNLAEISPLACLVHNILDEQFNKRTVCVWGWSGWWGGLF